MEQCLMGVNKRCEDWATYLSYGATEIEREAMRLERGALEEDERECVGPRFYPPQSYWLSLARAIRWMKEKGVVLITERGKQA